MNAKQGVSKRSALNKLIALASVLLIMVVVLSGCGSKEGEPTTQATPTYTVHPERFEPTLKGTITSELEAVLDKAEKYSTYTCETITNMVTDNSSLLDITMKQKMWYKAPKMLIETTTVSPPGNDEVNVSLMDGSGEPVQWIKGAPVAYRIIGKASISTNQAQVLNEFAGKGFTDQLLGITSGSPEVLGTETFDDKECLVVEYSMVIFSGKAWIWKETGIPLKSIITSSYFTMSTEYYNIDFSDIPDSVFKLPDYVTIRTQDISQGPDALEAILAKAKKFTAVKYDWTENVTTGGQNISYYPKGTDWMKGKKYRRDPLYPDPTVRTWTILDVDSQNMTIYSEVNFDGKITGTHISVPTMGTIPAQGSIYFLLAGTDILYGYTETVVGTEKIGDMECTVLQYDNIGVSMKYWIWTEYGLIVRQETHSGSSDSNTDFGVYNYSNFDFSDIPDTMFD